jgi:membrane protein DedA with SNARE-associated domain
MEAFIAKYGYWAVLFGSVIEGESIILTASALAALKKLSLLKVFMITFLGTCFADQMIFILGRLFGQKFLMALLNRFHFLRQHADRALSFLKKHETLYIMSFRFIYGIRVISPFIIGVQGISFARFFVLNIISGFVWTVISCGAGYYLGHLVGIYTKNIAVTIFSIFLCIFLVGFLIKKTLSFFKK